MKAPKLRHLADEEESYFVSMTDLMVGMLFVFIIMLMSFSLNLKHAEEVSEQTNTEIKGAQKAREQMLNDIKKTLEEHGVQVMIDERNGILRLPEEILFNSGKEELKEEGVKALHHVAEALRFVLPCYSTLPGSPPSSDCPSFPGGRLEAVFVEGHTDSDKLHPTKRLRDNWDLSAARSINTYKILLKAKPLLEKLKNDRGDNILGVSGYGSNRPAQKIKRPDQTEESFKKANRRIDLRFLMASPTHEDVERIGRKIRQKDGQ